MRIAIFASEDVGLEIVKYFYETKTAVHLLVLDLNDTYYEQIKKYNTANCVADSTALQDFAFLQKIKSMELDLVVLAWWHHIITLPLLDAAKFGFLNFHPSLLPYNRGKHYYFWNLIEKAPFGVTLHLIDETIDKGKVLFQKKLDTSIVDTGRTLRDRAKIEIVELFKDNFLKIVNCEFSEINIDWSMGSYHNGRELEDASKIKLDASYCASDFLDLLRARSGFDSGGVWFECNGKKYEVDICIREKK